MCIKVSEADSELACLFDLRAELGVNLREFSLFDDRRLAQWQVSLFIQQTSNLVARRDRAPPKGAPLAIQCQVDPKIGRGVSLRKAHNYREPRTRDKDAA